ncbi:hypothetical protein SG34_013540 [Thalassomonas viridans]|uniref:Uncharacterized protein n=1 Tax=Thalassomonas viridans TaxID=137584 RepID=A0AAE9Z7Y8_9GAMM|nr:hypothetical protein [Thalassomonas viridans]WDE07809.1 hypothetical protein SG34_013540 [Thalassomonas viridans]
MTISEIFLEKGLLAVILSVFTFVLARVLERYKRDQAVFTELAKLRSKSLVEAFNLLSEYESKVHGTLVHVVKKETELAKEMNGVAQELHAQLIHMVDANRFLLGEELYKLCIEFSNLQTSKLKAVDISNLDKLKSIDLEISRIRVQVQRYLPGFKVPE